MAVNVEFLATLVSIMNIIVKTNMYDGFKMFHYGAIKLDNYLKPSICSPKYTIVFSLIKYFLQNDDKLK